MAGLYDHAPIEEFPPLQTTIIGRVLGIEGVSENIPSQLQVLPPQQLLAAAGLEVPGARVCTYGVQLLPGCEAGTDGFYYACLKKDTSGPH